MRLSFLASVTLVSWLFLPESPRWLIARGKTEAARKIIEAAAETNKVKLSQDVLSEEKVESGQPEHPVYGLGDLFRRSQLLITLPLFFCWPVITMLYYGLSLSADKIKMTDNVYLSYILVSLIEMPAYIFLPLIIGILQDIFPSVQYE